jgi:hypothetical protein
MQEGGRIMKKAATTKRAKGLARKTVAGWVDPMATPIDIPKGL